MAADNFPKSTKADLNSWLSSLGFEVGNPFATVEAEQERNLLPEYFVDVDGYERIKSDKTIIVFAPRGGGKSALRVVLASHSAPTSSESKSLAIEYTDFSPLIAKMRLGEKITIDDHVNHLLRVGVRTLASALLGGSKGMDVHKTDREKVDRHILERLNAILPPVRSRAARWLRTFQPELMEPEEIYERLNALDTSFTPDWIKFQEHVRAKELNELLKQSPLSDNAIAVFMADLNDFSVERWDLAMTPTEKMLAFVAMVRSLGFVNVQILVDGLDESQETADDPWAQVNILEPLVAELRILEMKDVSFKFFLSLEVYKTIMERSTIRRDRITDEAVTVHWRKDRLKRLLDERLDVFSNGTIHELVQICQETYIEVEKGTTNLVGEWIEDEMLKMSQGSPRRLLLGGQLLFEAHFSRFGSSGLLEQEDWNIARENLLRKMPPVLLLYKNKHTVQVGELAKQLSPLQHRILLTLANNSNICDKQELIEKAWEAKEREGVMPATIDKAISRIREILGDKSDNPVYLRTIKGRGYQLVNCEIV